MKRVVKGYTIITCESRLDLADEVRAFLAQDQGWEPVGGVVITLNAEGEQEFMQTMVRVEYVAST